MWATRLCNTDSNRGWRPQKAVWQMKINSLWANVMHFRRGLLILFTTYIPAVFIAGYINYAINRKYIGAFVVGGLYMLGLLIFLLRIAAHRISPK